MSCNDVRIIYVNVDGTPLVEVDSPAVPRPGDSVLLPAEDPASSPAEGELYEVLTGGVLWSFHRDDAPTAVIRVKLGVLGDEDRALLRRLLD